jgi:hypothetical protein
MSEKGIEMKTMKTRFGNTPYYLKNGRWVVGYEPKEKPVKRKLELSILVPVLLVLAWTILDIVGR